MAHVQPPSSRIVRGFTLIELLVVISITALLIALLLPALAKARDTAKDSVCQSNARSIAMSIHAYAADNREKLVPFIMSPWPMAANSRFYTHLLVEGGYLSATQWQYPDRAWGDIRTGVWLCPRVTTLAYGGGYGVNFRQLIVPLPGGTIGGEPFTIGSIKKPSNVWLIGDATQNTATDASAIYIDCTNPWGLFASPTTPQPSTRHNSSMTNAAMVDGHVELLSVQKMRDAADWSRIGQLFYIPGYR